MTSADTLKLESPETPATEKRGVFACSDLLAAMELLKNRKREINRQIEILQAEIDHAKRTDRLKAKYGDYGEDSRRHRIAKAVLVDGKTIKDAALEAHTGQVNARKLLHDYCRNKNPRLYESGYHHNVYAGGWENDCPPLLEWLRGHAHDFCG